MYTINHQETDLRGRLEFEFVFVPLSRYLSPLSLVAGAGAVTVFYSHPISQAYIIFHRTDFDELF